MQIESLTRPEFFAILSIGLSLVRHGTYIWAIYKGAARPHVFSYVNWGLVVGIGAFAQRRLDSGLSSAVLFVVAAGCLLIAFLSLFRGEKNITRGDWIAFLGALAAVPVWRAMGDPVYAVAVLVVIDMLSYYPTVRKSWSDPWGEPPLSFFWAGLRYFFALFTVTDLTLSGLFYPFFLMATDWGFMVYLLWRRRLMPHGKE